MAKQSKRPAVKAVRKTKPASRIATVAQSRSFFSAVGRFVTAFTLGFTSAGTKAARRSKRARA